MLISKTKGKYQLLDFSHRGSDDRLGLRDEHGRSGTVIDILHRSLWLMENQPRELVPYLQQAQPNREQLRLVAQALAGPVLRGGELGEVSSTDELAALSKLTANWRSVIDDAMQTALERAEKRTGQQSLFQ
jgi:putative DNA methylase